MTGDPTTTQPPTEVAGLIERLQVLANSVFINGAARIYSGEHSEQGRMLLAAADALTRLTAELSEANEEIHSLTEEVAHEAVSDERSRAELARCREALERVDRWINSSVPIGTESATFMLRVVREALTPKPDPAP